MTHIGNAASANRTNDGVLGPGDAPLTAVAVIAPPQVKDATSAAVAAVAHAVSPPLPPPSAPYVPVDEQTRQAMHAWQAEVSALGAHWQRWHMAQDMANEALLQHDAATAASGGMFPAIDAIRDGGMHYFMRLRMLDSHSGAAELRRLAQNSAQAQQRHLEEQRACAKAAQAAVEKMKPWLARAHIASVAAHGLAMATACAVGASLAVTAATPLAAVAAVGLTGGLLVAAVLGGAGTARGNAEGGLQQALTALDMAALTGVLLVAAQVNPALVPALAVSRGVDVLSGAGTRLLESRLQCDVREAQALGHVARLSSSVHERGYASSMDAVQRIGQSHARVLSIINAMLRSNQQVSNLQIRNLRK